METDWNPKALAGEFVYALSNRGILQCLEKSSGEVHWEKDLVSEYNVFCPGYGFAGSPVIEGNLIILNVNYHGLALDKRTASRMWSSEKYHPTKSCHEGRNQGGYATPIIYDFVMSLRERRRLEGFGHHLFCVIARYTAETG
jgi:hypothetical protein